MEGIASTEVGTKTGTEREVMMAIPRFTATGSLDHLVDALDEAGCAVVTDVMDDETRAAIRSDLAPSMTAAEVGTDDPAAFYPGQTRRVTALVARSATVTDHLLANRISTDICDALLLPNSPAGYQLHVTAALEVGPGARSQILHREEDPFPFFQPPRPTLIVASMWAVSDFRAENGATLLVPGSHRWPGDRRATEDEIVPAEMPAGSVLYWLGGTLHGAGASTAEDWRYGVILTYSLGWLRQEENQYLDVPPARRAELSPEVRRLAGFDMHGALGFHDPSVHDLSGSSA
ncbi:MAG: phytanoyl-CoA dioxygenase family protein [Actinomycetota bacterium]